MSIVRALSKRNRFEFVVLEQDILVFAAGVALDFVVLADWPAGFGVDRLAEDSIARPAVQHVEANLVLLAGRSRHCHRTSHQ